MATCQGIQIVFCRRLHSLFVYAPVQKTSYVIRIDSCKMTVLFKSKNYGSSRRVSAASFMKQVVHSLEKLEDLKDWENLDKCIWVGPVQYTPRPNNIIRL